VSYLEDAFIAAWHEFRPWLPEPEIQYRFVAKATGGVGRGLTQRLHNATISLGLHQPLKDYRADFAWPDAPNFPVAVEMDGLHGGHHSFAGWLRDVHKGNLYTLFGWRYLRFTRFDIVDSNQKMDMVRMVTVLLKQAGYPVVALREQAGVTRINETLKIAAELHQLLNAEKENK
jgi:very-short-patch-repair endonuclease